MFLFLKLVIRAARLICVFSVDKLVTDHLPHICIVFFLAGLGQNYQRPRINTSDQFQRFQISAELPFATVRHYSYYSGFSRHPQFCLCLFDLFVPVDVHKIERFNQIQGIGIMIEGYCIANKKMLEPRSTGYGERTKETS